MKLIPLAGYVLIEPIDDQETTASGLVMPEKAKEKPGKGKIIGKGVYMESKEYNLKMKHSVLYIQQQLSKGKISFMLWATSKYQMIFLQLITKCFQPLISPFKFK